MHDYVKDAVNLWQEIQDIEEAINMVNNVREKHKRVMNLLSDEEMKQYLAEVKKRKQLTPTKQNE